MVSVVACHQIDPGSKPHTAESFFLSFYLFITKISVKLAHKDDLHVFHIAGIGLAVGPLEVADDTSVAVLVEKCVVGGGEKGHGQRQEEAHQPNTHRDADRHRLAHSRPQRMHDGHVPICLQLFI